MERYRVLSHTADTAIEAEAPSLGGLVENLAYGMFDLMFDLAEVGPITMTELDVETTTVEDLIVDALSELLFEAETRDHAFSSFSVRVNAEENSARIIAAGSPIATPDLRGSPIKAVTYHDLEVSRGENGWYGRVVFDV